MGPQFTVYDHIESRTAQSQRDLLAVTSVVLGSLLIALGARLQIVLPGLAAPVTAQTIIVLALGMVLGARLGMAAASLFLLECLFIPGFSAAKILITGGYVAGFIPAAYLAGHFYHGGYGRTWSRALLAMIPANLIILIVGASWLAMFQLSFGQAFRTGFASFLIIDAIKIALCVPMMFGIAKLADGMERRLR
ncbi:MAG: biotin transporter BioY [Planctomycetota bacterium]